MGPYPDFNSADTNTAKAEFNKPSPVNLSSPGFEPRDAYRSTEQLAERALKCLEHFGPKNTETVHQLRKASEQLEPLLVLSSTPAKTLYLWAHCQWALYQADANPEFNSYKVLQIALQATKVDPNLAEAHWISGEILNIDAGNRLFATSQFRKAIQTNPLRAKQARLSLAKTLLSCTDLGSQLTGYLHLVLASFYSPQQSWNQVKESLTDYIQALKEKAFWPNNTLPRRAGEPLEQEVHTMIHSAETNSFEPDDSLDRLHSLFQETEGSQPTIETYQAALEDNPNDVMLLSEMGQAHSDDNRFMEALYYYRRSLDIKPNQAETYSDMAYVLFRMNDYDGAIECYKQAIDFGKDPIWRSTVAQTLATLYQQIQQDWTQATAYFKLGVELNPSNQDCRSSLVEGYCKQGRYADAIGEYKLLIDENPDDPALYNFLGYLYWQAQQDNDAIQAYQRAIVLSDMQGEQNAVACNNLGVIFLDVKQDAAEALNLFEKAAQQNESYAMAWFNQARSHEALGQTKKAIQCYGKASALNDKKQELPPEEIYTRLDALFTV